mmetsp:Transcript_20915/g.67694  ORF Transcript_20915/g.67694 Transcript_20915/m.67694 type:complete len:425 (-) Transcript_20915:40-1314(-)
MPHVVYCTAHVYGAPFPDEQGRRSSISALSLSDDGSQLTLVQQVPLPEGTLVPLVQTMNAARTRLFTIAGKNGIATYFVDPNNQGRFVSDEPVCSPTTPEPMPTPWGVWPIFITLDVTEAVAYCNHFIGASVSALAVDMEAGTLSQPRLTFPAYKGIPEKVKKMEQSAAAKALGWPEGAPEDQAHPHGSAVHPGGKWLVVCDMGSNAFHVYALPVGEAFEASKPDFTLEAHTAPAGNRHHGAGPKNICFSRDGSTLFSVNENDHTASAYSFDSGTGELRLVGAPQMCVPEAWLDSAPLPFPHFAQPNYNGGLALSPDGRHLYCSTRGHDSVAGFAVATDGALSPTAQASVGSGGRVPWELSFASDELLVVANQYRDDPEARAAGGAGAEPGNVTVFRRNPADGSLAPTGAVWEVPFAMGVFAAS